MYGTFLEIVAGVSGYWGVFEAVKDKKIGKKWLIDVPPRCFLITTTDPISVKERYRKRSTF